MRRQEATSRGVVCGASCFIATMLVPQKKKGDTRSRRASREASGPAGGRLAGSGGSGGS